MPVRFWNVVEHLTAPVSEQPRGKGKSENQNENGDDIDDHLKASIKKAAGISALRPAGFNIQYL